MKRILIFMLPLILAFVAHVMVLVHHSIFANRETKIAFTAQVVFGKGDIISLQQALKKTNFYQGKINGILNAATHRALRQFQQAHDLAVTSEPNEETLQMLGVMSVPDGTAQNGVVLEKSR